MLLRESLLFLSRHRELETFLKNNALALKAKARFIAGQDLVDVVPAAKKLHDMGFRMAIDHLGEDIDNEDNAQIAVDERKHLISGIADMSPEISIRLSQIGLRINRKLASQKLTEIAETLCEKNLFLRVEMEGSELVEQTIKLISDLHKQYENIGMVLQSYLRRSSDDLDHLNRLGIPVRVVKGSYLEAENQSFKSQEEVTLNFMRMIEALMRDGVRPAIGTHDEKLIEYAADMAYIYQRPSEEFEFHMFYGVKPTLQARTLQNGHAVRVVIPYGEHWFPYLMRLFAERPALLWAFLKGDKA